MRLTKLLLTVFLLMACAGSILGQNRPINLDTWVGKTPLIPGSKPRQGIYTSPELRPRLIALLGRKYYRRLVYDYYVMSPMEIVDGYLIAEMCKQHACPSSASFMAVNLTHGDIHVAFWRSGYVEWFHTRGKATDLPYNVVRKPWWMNAPHETREITRGATS